MMEFSLMTETSLKACAVKEAVKAVVLLEFSSASLLNTQEKCSYTNPPLTTISRAWPDISKETFV